MSAHACRNKNFLKLLCSIYTFLFYNRCIHETTNESIQLLHTQSENIGVFTPMLCIANWVLDNLKICVDATYSSTAAVVKVIQINFQCCMLILCLRSCMKLNGVRCISEIHWYEWFNFSFNSIIYFRLICVQCHNNKDSIPFEFEFLVYLLKWSPNWISLHTREYIWWSVNNKMW